MPQSQLRIHPSQGIRGDFRLPGDKSISHRIAMLASLMDRPIKIQGFLRSDDCLATLAACRQLGATVEDVAAAEGDNEPEVIITGRSGGLLEPADVIDVGNAGTGIRLLLGLLAAHPVFAVLTGDASIRRRPMGRVVDPLRQMGARIDGRNGGRLAPLAIHGGPLRGLTYSMPVASAQLKTALLFAGLFAGGTTTLEEPAPSRDHTERMLTALGADIHWEPGRVQVRPGSGLRAPREPWRIPGDFSSAAFFLVAASVTPNSELILRDVGLNPTRTGLLDILWEMGADIRVENQREWNGEPVGDLHVRTARLRGVDVGGAVIPRAIDELPIFAVAAAAASGTSRVQDAAELRVKESDRIGGLQQEMARIGLAMEAAEDGFIVPGDQRIEGGTANSLGDHRLAMSLAVAGLVSQQGVRVNNVGCIAASFPNFTSLLQRATEGEGAR